MNLIECIKHEHKENRKSKRHEKGTTRKYKRVFMHMRSGDG
jgi:hypothetical protein